MSRRRMGVLFNILGMILLCAGSAAFIFPVPNLRSAVALALIVSGSVLQSSFARFDLYGKTYMQSIESAVSKMFRVDVVPASSLGGRQTLSTIVNLVGIPLLVGGFYLIMTPAFMPGIALGGVAVGVGLYLLIRIRPSVRREGSDQGLQSV